MIGMLNNMTSKKMDLKKKIPFLVYVINNYQNNVGFEHQTHFCVNEPSLNNDKSTHKCTRKNTKQLAYLAFVCAFKMFSGLF